MKNKLIASLTLAGMLTGTTAFAAENPFATVPKDYWAYTAVEQLVSDGLVDGYNLEDFHDKKVVARYDLAQFIARAMANEGRANAEQKVILNKLQDEYSNELKIMTVIPAEPAKTEAQPAQNNNNNFFDNGKIKWFGDARVRYQRNYTDNPRSYTANADESVRRDGKNSRIQERLRLGFYAEPDDNLSVLGRLKFENTLNDDTRWGTDGDTHHGEGSVDLLALTYKNNNTAVTVGRQNLNLGQGLLFWDNPMDGILVTQDLGNNASVSAGWGDLTAATWQDHTTNAFVANVKAPINDNTNLTLAYLKTNSNNNRVYGTRKNQWNWIESTDNPYMFNSIAYGFNTQLSDKWKLKAEGVSNMASGLPDDAQKNGWWTRLIYGNLKWDTKGTWEVYADYMHLGNYSIDSSAWPHILNTPGGDGVGGNGEKGFGLGVSYMLANNTNLALNWYKLKPYDSDYSGFSDYYDMYNLELNYSF